ncbi:MAG: cytidylate kinase-like family protein [Candidatus Magnetomorum sp.]|nr:cytidylate kinase-like family protein [Candidatus Magnetomorum sp.]
MAIITISRGCFSHGKEIAEKTAEMLGYKIMSREILLDAAQFFHISEKEVLKSIHDAPTILERLTHGKEKYLLYIQAALLQHVKNDNVVYHGHAGHVLLPDISTIFKVRIIADTDERIKFLKQTKNFSSDKARTFIEEEDKQRSRWTQYIYNLDINDPKLYDMVLKVGKLSIQDACDIICAAVRTHTYQTTDEAMKTLEDIALSSYIKVAIQKVCQAEVSSIGGNIHIKTHCPKIKKSSYTSTKMQHDTQEKLMGNLSKEISDIVHTIDGVKEVIIDILPPSYSC